MSIRLHRQKPHTIGGVTCLNMAPVENCPDEFSTMTLYLQAQTFSFLARSAQHLNLHGFGLDSAKRALELYQQFQEAVVDPTTRAGAKTVVDAFANGELRQRIFTATIVICQTIGKAEKSIAAGQVGDSYLTVAEQIDSRMDASLPDHLLRRIVQTDDFDRFTVLGSYHIKQGHGDAAERERERVAILEMALQYHCPSRDSTTTSGPTSGSKAVARAPEPNFESPQVSSDDLLADGTQDVQHLCVRIGSTYHYIYSGEQFRLVCDSLLDHSFEDPTSALSMIDQLEQHPLYFDKSDPIRDSISHAALHRAQATAAFRLGDHRLLREALKSVEYYVHQICIDENMIADEIEWAKLVIREVSALHSMAQEHHAMRGEGVHEFGLSPAVVRTLHEIEDDMQSLSVSDDNQAIGLDSLLKHLKHGRHDLSSKATSSGSSFVQEKPSRSKPYRKWVFEEV